MLPFLGKCPNERATLEGAPLADGLAVADIMCRTEPAEERMSGKTMGRQDALRDKI